MTWRVSSRSSGLPVDTILSALRATLDARPEAVVQAPPGAGKTTVVPLALLDAPWLAGLRIIMLEPRRLAARAAAQRMAWMLGEDVGATVGFRMRLDTRVGPDTRIEVVTEGVLTRMLLHDPTLDGYGIVIFDEFHERSLHADTALALTLHTRRLVRPELRVLVMSATLDGAAIARHLSDARVLISEGKQFPVITHYLGTPRVGAVDSAVARGVHQVLRETEGDVLVFLPGTPEIWRVASLLENQTLPEHTVVAPLHGRLSQEEQDRAIARASAPWRKVVLATSIAETSLTIEGIRSVVDSGLSRLPRFSPRTGMSRLHTVRVSRAAAEQRRGRAGRVAPGQCYRLWHEADQAQLREFAPAEILDGDLAPLALDLAVAGIPDPLQLTWLDPPPPAAYAQAVELLRELMAIDERGRVTEHGRRMAAFSAHPRLAHMILRATADRRGALACDLAALLGERDLLRNDAVGVDVLPRLDLLRSGHRSRPPGRDERAVSAETLRRVRVQAGQWRALAGAKPNDYVEGAAGRVLALAYPDRVAQRRRGARPRYVLRNGPGAALPEGDGLSAEPLLVIAESDGKHPESRISLAASLTRDDLEEDFADQIRVEDRVVWSDDEGIIRAWRERRLGAIVLARKPLQDADGEAVAAAIADAARRSGLRMLPWTDEATRLRARLRTLRHHDASWPDMSDDALQTSLLTVLAPRLAAVRSASDLRRVDVHQALLELLGWQQRAQLDRLVPTHFVAPTGSRIPIDYGDPAAPTVAVRLQEMFGVATTPAIVGGAVPLVLHLLSPAHRPVQVTRDLGGFWRTSYFDARKELRGRYPKHHWPDDPLAATPTARAKRAR